MPHIVQCPSGLAGTIRGLKVREEQILADRKLAKSGSVVDELLRACWEETHQSGPYTFNGKVDWDLVLQGDRFHALLEIRALTYGPDYAFAVTCRENACRARIEWELDLRKLPTRALSEESRAASSLGNRFETTLPDAGKRGVVPPPDRRGRAEAAIRKNAGDRMLWAILAFGVVEVEGVDERERRRRFLEDLSMRDADFLVDEFDRVDCGVDTTMESGAPVLRGPGGAAPFRSDVLHAGEGPDCTEAGPQWVLPGVDLDAWREAIFALCWSQHGGSGLGLSLSDALELPVSDRDWLVERVDTQRTREAWAIEHANRKR